MDRKGARRMRGAIHVSNQIRHTQAQTSVSSRTDGSKRQMLANPEDDPLAWAGGPDKFETVNRVLYRQRQATHLQRACTLACMVTHIYE